MDAKSLGQQPASPVNGYTVDASGTFCGENVRAPGLTKRELFAAMAMQGLCADTGTAGMKLETLTVQSVELADALLAELAKEQP